MHIILVHGFFDTGKIFKTLQGQLTANGHKCYAPDLKPADARLGIANLAEKLKTFIDQNVGQTTPIALIGFSMGCLICRYYLQELEGHQRTIALFTISGPHHGTLTALAYPGKGARDMRPNSTFLNNLNKTAGNLSAMPLYSYRTPFDLMIVPSRSSHWQLANNIQVKALSHTLMLKHQKVSTHITTTLQQLAKASSH